MSPCDKPNPENCKNCSCKCAYHCAQLSYTTQYGAILIIFPLNLQTSITALTLSIGGQREWFHAGIMLELLHNILQLNVVCTTSS